MGIENYIRIYTRVLYISLYILIYNRIYQQQSPESERNQLQAKDGVPQKTPPFFLSLVSGNLERDFWEELKAHQPRFSLLEEGGLCCWYCLY